jgi:hypothetical protein
MRRSTCASRRRTSSRPGGRSSSEASACPPRLGQPGQDELYGNGGDDIIDARDGVRDFVIQCGFGTYFHPPRKPKEKGPPPEPILKGTPAGRALTDSFDPAPALCTDVVIGEPVDGLNNSG